MSFWEVTALGVEWEVLDLLANNCIKQYKIVLKKR